MDSVKKYVDDREMERQAVKDLELWMDRKNWRLGKCTDTTI